VVKTVLGSSGTFGPSSEKSYSTDNGPTKIVPGAVTFQNTEAMSKVSRLSSGFENTLSTVCPKRKSLNKMYLLEIFGNEKARIYGMYDIHIFTSPSNPVPSK
jgi:hypothetical protein